MDCWEVNQLLGLILPLNQLIISQFIQHENMLIQRKNKAQWCGFCRPDKQASPICNVFLTDNLLRKAWQLLMLESTQGLDDSGS